MADQYPPQNEDELAHRMARRFIEILKDDHDIDIRALQDVIEFHQSMSRWSRFLAQSVIATIVLSIVGGGIYLFTEGVKNAIRALHG